MTDTIKLVEQPVGSGKTYHVIRSIVNAGGLVIYCAPTKILVNQIKADIEKVISLDEYHHRSHIPVDIVTEDDLGYCEKVSERLEELILDTENLEAIIVCTLPGFELVDEAVISKAVEELSKRITLVIDELPSLFSPYHHAFEGTSYKRLAGGMITVENGIPRIDDSKQYGDTIKNKPFNENVERLLELIPKETVRLEASKDNDKRTFYGYDLKTNLKANIMHIHSVYILAATIRNTLDYIVLKDVWKFNLEDCEILNTKIEDDKIKEKEGNVRVYPLFDDKFSRGKATDKYKPITPDMNSCLFSMIENAISFIGDKPALMMVNKWGMKTASSYVNDKDNIKLLPPNIKGLNEYRDRHICCTIFSAKPNNIINQSLLLMASKYSLTKLSDAFTLQAELDMIVQSCGRTSIRDRGTNEICHFLVSDMLQAQHVLDTYVADKSVHENLLDKSLMVNWSDYTTAKMGRPKSEERLEMGRDMIDQLEYAKSIGEPMKQKELVRIFDVQESAVSKILKDSGYKK